MCLALLVRLLKSKSYIKRRIFSFELCLLPFPLQPLDCLITYLVFRVFVCACVEQNFYDIGAAAHRGPRGFHQCSLARLSNSHEFQENEYETWVTKKFIRFVLAHVYAAMYAVTVPHLSGIIHVSARFYEKLHDRSVANNRSANKWCDTTLYSTNKTRREGVNRKFKLWQRQKMDRLMGIDLSRSKWCCIQIILWPVRIEKV